jgi:hypothetical protein
VNVPDRRDPSAKDAKTDAIEVIPDPSRRPRRRQSRSSPLADGWTRACFNDQDQRSTERRVIAAASPGAPELKRAA